MRGVRRLIVLLLSFAAAAACSGCGKKGPLIPPEALAPAPIADLAVAQRGGRFQVSWSVPSKQEGGGRLSDLAGFLLFRRPVLPTGEDCEECPTAYPQAARIYLDLPQGARRMGNLMIVDDPDLAAQKTYQYKVRSFTADGRESGDSNKVRRTAVIPPLPPVLEATSSTSGVVLTFVALPPEQGSPIGYNVYRAKEGGAMPLTPLNAAPLTAVQYEDREVLIGTRYSYWVTALAKVGTDTVESVPSNSVTGSIAERD